LYVQTGVISGIVVAGFGLGGAFFNVLGAYICNPVNKQPDPFFDEDVADRVPLMFMVSYLLVLLKQQHESHVVCLFSPIFSQQ